MSKVSSFVVLLLLASSAFAQQAGRSAELSGTITDPTGASVAGAKITVTNVATNFVVEGQSNETGRYYIPYLMPGAYKIEIQAQGFATYVRTGIELRAGDAPRIDFALKLGSVSEAVTVSGTAPLLQTEDAISAGSMTNQVFERVPVMQGMIGNVLIYLPGVITTGYNAFTANGQPMRAIGNSLDGVSAAIPVLGTPIGLYTLNPAMDSVEEVRVITSGIPAEYGHASSAAMVMVMKSGTNQLHGSLEDRYLNNELLHRMYFDSVKPNPTSYHEMQASLLGPVVLPKLYNGKDRTFFLVGFEWHLEKASETGIYSVPNQDMYNGNFSFGGLGLPIYNPATTRQNSTGAWIRDPFSDNQIPVSSFDAVTKKFLSYNPWRQPNQAGYMSKTGPVQNLAVPTRYRSNYPRFDFKIDQQLSSAHRFFVRYNWSLLRRKGDRGVGDLAWDLLVNTFQPYGMDVQGGAFSDTYTINNSTVSEFRFGYTRYKNTSAPTSANQGWAQKLGIPNVSGASFPVFANINGYNDNPGGYSSIATENFTIAESISKLAGNHNFKAGYEVIRSRANNVGATFPSGTYNMGGTEFPFTTNTGNGFASFLLGSVQSATFTENKASWLPRWWSHAFYAQDNYKISRKVSLSYGLRWTYETPYNTKYGQQSQFDPNVADPVTGLIGSITHPKGALASRYLKNFQPRLGLAYNFAPKWVFRSNFGIQTQDLLSTGSNMAFDEYVGTYNAQRPAGDPQSAFYLSQGPGVVQYPLNPDGSVRYSSQNYSARTATRYDTHMRNPYIMMWTGALQYEFASTWLVEMNYQGSAGVGLFQAWNINTIPLDISTDPATLRQIYQATQNYLPYRQFGTITNYSNFGHSTFHSGTVRLEKRLSHGVTLNSTYTRSKAINTADTDGSMVSGITYYNRSLEKGVAGYDRTNRWVVTFTGDPPFGVGRRFLNSHGWKDILFGGWQFTWSQTAQSGIPFTVTFAHSPNQYLPGLLRPNVLLPFSEAQPQPWHIGPNRFPTSAQNPYFDFAAFAYPASFTAGTLGRNTFRSPFTYWAQASLSKHWDYRERLRFYLRWDVNNVTKEPEFARPNSMYDLTNLGAFGRFTSVLENFAGVGSRFHSVLVFRIEF